MRRYVMISFNLNTQEIFGDRPDVIDFLSEMAQVLTEQEMATIAGVSISAIKNWKTKDSFPRSQTGRITRISFLKYLIGQNNTK